MQNVQDLCQDNFRTLLTQMMTLTHGISLIFLVKKIKIGQSRLVASCWE